MNRAKGEKHFQRFRWYSIRGREERGNGTRLQQVKPVIRQGPLNVLGRMVLLANRLPQLCQGQDLFIGERLAIPAGLLSLRGPAAHFPMDRKGFRA